MSLMLPSYNVKATPACGSHTPSTKNGVQYSPSLVGWPQDFSLQSLGAEHPHTRSMEKQRSAL